MKINYFAVSFNPNEYNAEEIKSMSVEEAKSFFENDTVGCANIYSGTVEECEKLVPEGNNYDLDSMVVWFY